jgi:L-galactose dehydrogenase
VILATKAGRYDIDFFDFSDKRLRRSVEESLTRLQTDFIDLYQLHDIEFVPRRGILAEALPGLARLREEGKIRYIGITGYPLPLLQEVAEQWPVDTILSYRHCNLMNTTLAQNLLPFANNKGIGLINASSLHMGLLTEQGGPPWHPAPKDVHEVSRKVAAFASEHGSNITRLALQYVIQNEEISSTLVGMRTEEEVRYNINLVGTKPDADLLTAVQAIIEPVKDFNWQVGLPENHEPDAAVPEIQRNL